MENVSSLQNCPPQPSQVSRCSNFSCLERFWHCVLFLGSSGSSFQSLKHFWRAQRRLQGTACGNCEIPPQQDQKPHPSSCSTQDVSNDAVCEYIYRVLNLNALIIPGLMLVPQLGSIGNLSSALMNAGPCTLSVVMLWKIIGVLRWETTDESLPTPAGNPSSTTLRR